MLRLGSSRFQGIGVCVSTKTAVEHTSVEYHYTIHSLDNGTAEAFGITGALMLDVAFREDESRCRKGFSAENFNISN